MAESTSQTSAEVACVGCGYDLTGVAIGNACPECGVPVSQTIDHGRAMTRRQAVTVVLRLAALVVLFTSLTLIDLIIWTAVALSGLSQQLSWQDEYFIVIVQGLPLIVRAAIAVAGWVFAPRLAVWLVQHDGAILQHGRTHPRELLSIGLVLLGVYAFLHGGSRLMIHLLDVFSEDPLAPYIYHYDAYGPSLLINLVWFIAGMILVGSPRLRARLGRDLR